jgi:hypothetical protein
LAIYLYSIEFPIPIDLRFDTHHTQIIAALVLGLQPKQGLAKVRAKSEAQESYFMLPEVWESVRE